MGRAEGKIFARFAIFSTGASRILALCVPVGASKYRNCIFGGIPDEHYKRVAWSNILDGTIPKALYTVINATAEVKSWLAAAAACPLAPEVAKDRNGELIHEFLRATLVKYQSENYLSGCQSDCLAMCASANLMTYRSGGLAKFDATSTLFKHPFRECTEFAEVGRTLARDLGLEAHWVVQH